MSIHPTAIISSEAEIHEEAHIEAYAVIKGRVRIGKGTRVGNHATVGCDFGQVDIGENNQFYPSCYVGGPPQDLSYKGEDTRLIVGNGNMVREFATINIGTEKGGGKTQIGDSNLIMTSAHIAHDCRLGNHVVVANACHFAGHVIVDDYVRIGGGCLLSQFITIGRMVYLAGDATVNKDLLPYTIAQGKYAVMRGVNKVGMERSGVDKEVIEQVKKAVRFMIMGNRTVEEAIDKIKADCGDSKQVHEIITAAQKSERGLAR